MSLSKKDLPHLPVDDYLAGIRDLLADQKRLVIVAEPGAGKTSRVPPALVADQRIVKQGDYLVMLQPRRTAARSAAEWIAREQGWRVGEEVGYQVRFESRIGSRTSLQVVTEGVLTRRLLNDPALARCGVVVLDEFHERSLDADLALMLLNETREAFRPDLGIVVMSATIDAERIAAHLGGCPIVKIPGRNFPVEMEYDQTSPQLAPMARVARAVEAAAQRPDSGDILVFLPGAREIRDVENSLRPLVDSQVIKNTDVRTLHGSLTLAEQMAVLAPGPKRRVILSTNIAETSLTINGVSTVVDSGLVRQAGFDDVSGVDTLRIKRISNASAGQRAGRAGRTGPGRCVRVWSAQETLEPFDRPELERLDLSGFLLSCLSWGWTDLEAIDWLTPPPPERLTSALQLLKDLGAIEPKTLRLTALGRTLAELPVHPRLGRVLVEAARLGRLEDGALAVALISERDFLSDDAARQLAGRAGHQSDLLLRLDLLNQRLPLPDRGVDRDSLSRVRQVGRQLEQLARKIRLDELQHKPIEDSKACRPNDLHNEEADDERLLARMILTGFSDRVCRRTKRGNATAFMARGLGVRLAPSSRDRDHEFFLALDPRREEAGHYGSEPVVRMAVGLEKDWLEAWLGDLIQTERLIEFDENSGRARCQVRKKLHALVIGEAEHAVAPEDQAQAFEAWVAQSGEELLRKAGGVADWLGRYEMLRKLLPERGLPEPDWAAAAEGWSAGCRSLAQLKSRPALSWIQSTLPVDAVRQVADELPESLVLPNGRMATIDYTTGLDQPMIQARVQDFFGWKDSPRLASGRLPILLEILAPNHRPVQRTLDLKSFWENTYPQVRKDLRGRYPKHHWPEDPWTATAGPSIRKKP